MKYIYTFIWNYKAQIASLSFLAVIICSYKLLDFKIFFESERIIEELTSKDLDQSGFKKNIDDENIILVAIKQKNGFDFESALELKQRITTIQELNEIKRVFSVLNEKYIPPSSLIPIPRNKLSLSSQSSFESTFDHKSSFISNDQRATFLIIETNKESTQDPVILLQTIKNILGDNYIDITFAGRIPSEIYFQDKVSKEFVFLAFLSCLLCLGIIYVYTQNLAILFMSFVCVVLTILVSTSLSLFLFGGVELFMIISPAIFFIVTVSDIMHLVNNQDYSLQNKKDIFLKKLDTIGIPVLITSLTTMISFFSFVLIDIKPLSHFGFITGLGVFIALFFSVLSYAFIVEFNHNTSIPMSFAKTWTNAITKFLHDNKYSVSLIVAICLIFSCYKVSDIKIDNYLLDELNPSSEFYQSSKFIDENFGGIKPLTIVVDSSRANSFEKAQFAKLLDDLSFSIDFSNETNQNKKIYNYLFKDTTKSLKYNCRVQDIGSHESNKLYDQVINFDENIDFAGIGHLFDSSSDMLTVKLIIGLLIAIFTVGVFLCLAFGLNIQLFFIGIIPNVLPLILTLGIVQTCFPFYLCLSNAFIFTVAFGLIIDDSIHIINAYMHYNKLGHEQEKLLTLINRKTANTILKTTSIVIICLLPLLLSEFKSVSQLAILTIISSMFAIIFDIGILPTILSKLIKSKG